MLFCFVSPRRGVRGPRQQSGITLAIMLVMLIIIGLTSAAVMRGALTADLVSNNLRLQTTATQAAQIALRYCEAEIVKTTPGITIQAAGSVRWTTFTNWHGTGSIATSVPDAYFASTSVAPLPAKRPQCLAERSALGSNEVIIVTARGFSPDYTEDTSGRSESGSVIWLQSTVQLADAPAP